MSDWKRSLVIVVPEGLMPQANQLALALGTSESDVETFKVADFAEVYSEEVVTESVDEEGNVTSYVETVTKYYPERYAVCATRAVSQILEYAGRVDVTDNPLLAEGLAALSFVTVTTDAEGVQTVTGNDPTKIRVVVDMEPFAALSVLGLHRIEAAE